MNIAVITFSDFNTNYGSILQSFAMRYFLESNGHKVTFIRYREFNPPPKQPLPQVLKNYAVRLYYRLHRNRVKLRYTNFQKFISEQIPHTRLYTSEEDLEHNLPEFDAYICGSDQIWNIPVLGGLREPYFLKFAPNKKVKIAYAPSFGEYLPNGDGLSAIINLIKDFDAISTREHNASAYLSSIAKLSVQTVVDPTLLMSPKEWLDNLPSFDIPNEEYGICYLVRRNSFCDKIVRMLKEKYHITIYNISNSLINVPRTDNKYVSCGPEAFVRLVAGAKFCVGTSFHLAAFSVIFNKPCYIAGSNHNIERVQNIFKISSDNKFILFDDVQLQSAINSPIKTSSIGVKDESIVESKQYLLNYLR